MVLRIASSCGRSATATDWSRTDRRTGDPLAGVVPPNMGAPARVVQFRTEPATSRPTPRCDLLLRLQEVGDVEQDELVVVLLVGLAASGVGEVVVVGDNDLRRVDDVDVLDGHEREGELAV